MDSVINNILNANSSDLRHVQICVLQVCIFLDHGKEKQRNHKNRVAKRHFNFASQEQDGTGANPSREVSGLVSYMKSLGFGKHPDNIFIQNPIVTVLIR